MADEHAPLPGVAWRLRATVRDVPGRLAAVAAALAAHRYDIVSMQVFAVPDGVVDGFLLSAPAGATAADIAAVTKLGGGKDVRVVPGRRPRVRRSAHPGPPRRSPGRHWLAPTRRAEAG
ncbi:ACT domain-containing protein [Amycolatopsis sp. EV170708-02-1]|uniref:ACT domain-containing protein n=1 Tax=Amycolatopsis sp. EV170708-02-1 TaxID=2919322 RepID=UPI001F0BC7B8|nr:ACT domain-containing protein [Amycolatopsis sp. EV170708-02-1]UMP06768.1 ACT domain-containing protein [Amycolatopsis sp. EV170708-02-1]